MGFAQILFLLGALAVAGPLLAHLLARPKFRRVPFTMMRFLQAGSVETQSRRNLHNFLVLALRCLIIVLIAMLFAGPRVLVRSTRGPAKTVHYLAVDDSLSTSYRSANRTCLHDILSRTEKYIRSAPPGDVFCLYSLASAASVTDVQAADAVACLRRMKSSPGVADFSQFVEAVQAARRTLDEGDTLRVFVAGDFTPKMLDLFSGAEKPVPVDGLEAAVVSPALPIDNLAITHAQVVEQTNRSVSVNVTVANYGQTRPTRRLSAWIHGKELTGMDVTVPPGIGVPFTIDIPFEATQFDEWYPLELRLDGADGLKEDDTYYLAFSVPRTDNIRIVVAGENEREMFLLKTAMDTLASMDPRRSLSVQSVAFAELTPSILSGVNVLVCTTPSPALEPVSESIRSLITAGSRAIFFVKEQQNDRSEALWRMGLVAALPGRLSTGPHSLAPQPGIVSQGSVILADSSAARILASYQMDRIVSTGCFECKLAADAAVLWRYQDGHGFLYAKSLGRGLSILVNTSADDSLGALMKSSAAVPFCRYLLGQSSPLRENVFTYGQRIVLPSSDSDLRVKEKAVSVLSPSGRLMEARVGEVGLAIPCPNELGWVKTQAHPVRYAGINPPEGETNLEPPAGDHAQKALERVFQPVTTRQGAKERTPAEHTTNDKQYNPIGRTFAWIIILLLLAEPLIANRMKR